jgi:hypothetical protein
MVEQVEILARVRNGEDQDTINREIARLSDLGIAVLYFNSQKSLDEWQARCLALSL